MANRVLNLPKDPQVAGQVISAEHATRVAEMGKFGVLFGSRDNATVYIAGLSILVILVGSIALALVEPSLRADIFKVWAAFLLAALGYMFGASARKSD